jgi:hypothetical protein
MAGRRSGGGTPKGEEVDTSVVLAESITHEDQDRPKLVDGQGAPEESAKKPEVELVLEDEGGEAGDKPKGAEGPRREAPRGEGGKGKDDDPEKRNLKAALKETRGKTRSIKAELETTRAQLAEEERKRKALESDAASKARMDKLDEAGDIKEALPHIVEEVFGKVEPFVVNQRKSIIEISQNYMRDRHTDYDDLLEKSGVAAGITLDTNGRPSDPVMWRRIMLDSTDPGRDAYQLSRELLGLEDDPAVKPNDKGGAPKEARREDQAPLRTESERPRGIGGLPASTGRELRRLSYEDIDKMNEVEYDKLPKHVKEEYLAGRPSAT